MVGESNPTRSDPFTELAMESIIRQRTNSEFEHEKTANLFNETPIHMNSTVVKGGKRDINSINATPINKPGRRPYVISGFPRFLSGLVTFILVGDRNLMPE